MKMLRITKWRETLREERLAKIHADFRAYAGRLLAGHGYYHGGEAPKTVSARLVRVGKYEESCHGNYFPMVYEIEAIVEGSKMTKKEQRELELYRLGRANHARRDFLELKQDSGEKSYYSASEIEARQEAEKSEFWKPHSGEKHKEE